MRRKHLPPKSNALLFPCFLRVQTGISVAKTHQQNLSLYLSLESTPQELHRNGFLDRKDVAGRHKELTAGTQEYLVEVEKVRRAMQLELFYRYLTRYWRRFHIALALLTLGLLVWHIVYALQLLLPTL